MSDESSGSVKFEPVWSPRMDLTVQINVTVSAVTDLIGRTPAG